MLEMMLNDICGADLFANVYETLNINWFSGSEAMTVVQGIHGVVQPVALMLMFIYFMITVVDKMSSDTFTWEQLWRQMAMLLASKYLIDHGFEILQLLNNIGVAMLGLVGGNASSAIENTIDAATLIEGFKESYGVSNAIMGFLVEILMVLFLLFPWIFSWVMPLCVNVVCYSRVIEIYARAAFAPIAISDFFHSGLQGGGWRFLKNFLAVSLQGAMILTISVIYSSLFAVIAINETSLFPFIGKYLAFYAAAIMLMFKSLSLTKELVGTN